MNEDYYFFWSGVFSNWHKCDIKIGNIIFNCVEQYMMYQKALTFEDYEAAIKILQTSNPREQKKLGRKVKGFNPTLWDKVKYQIVKTGVKQKFKQHASLRYLLTSNKGKIFVEASPYDRIWGIGFFEDEALANIDLWGENLLGKIITELSNEMVL